MSVPSASAAPELPITEIRSTAGKVPKCLNLGQTVRSTDMPSTADSSPLPVAQLVQQLKPQTQLPILLPARLPLADLSEVDFDVNGTIDRYEIGIYLKPGCRAGACYYASFAAERNAEFSPPSGLPRETYRDIQLANGVSGIYANACGAYCTAVVEWRQGNVLYRITGKNGSQPTLMELANSAIRSGQRN